MKPTPALTIFPVIGLPVIEPDSDLGTVIAEQLEAEQLHLEAGDVVAVAQKIVSKAENRFVSMSEITPSAAALELQYSKNKDPRMAELVLRESNRIVRDTPDVIIAEHRSGIVLANAGIDRSNVSGNDDTALLLPEDADASARRLQKQLAERFGIPVGVLITDSVGRPWRLGTTGIAIGCAGIHSLHDMRGRLDLFGREQQVAEVATADSLAGIAAMVMGENDESIPAVVMRGLDVSDIDQPATALLRAADEDLFR